jgi:DNA-binding NarL/FixJ family response regulator
MSGKTKIILADDHAVVRAGFRMLLAGSDTIEVIGEAARGEQAIQRYQELKPDVLVMDLSMPGIGGLETMRRIIQRDPEAVILVFSIYHEQVYVQRALLAGARGYITKNSAPEILAEAICAIMRGERYIERGLLSIPSPQESPNDYQTVVSGFTEREFDVFRLLAAGLTVHGIADQLCLGYKTAANYATQIRKKLRVTSAVELAHIAEDLGITQR